MDGEFKEEDKLEVERSFYEDPDMSVTDFLDNYEILKVTVPDDGKKVHQIRFRLRDQLADISELLPVLFKEQHVLYLVQGDERIRLEKTGTMGGYSTYDIEGNEFTLSIGIYNSDKLVFIVVAGLITVVLLILIILILIIVSIRKHGGKLPKIFRSVTSTVSEKKERSRSSMMILRMTF